MTKDKVNKDDILNSLKGYINRTERDLEETDARLLEEGEKQFSEALKEKIEKQINPPNTPLTRKQKILKGIKGLFKLLLILGLLFALYYYGFRHNPEIKAIEYQLTTTRIEQILNDPRRYDGKNISVSGIVTQSFSLGVKYYVISDETGEIYVLTNQAVPNEGELVKVTGQFNQLMKVGNMKVSTIIEE